MLGRLASSQSLPAAQPRDPAFRIDATTRHSRGSMLCMATDGSTIIPSFRYNDAHAAIAWFERVLGFTRQAVYEGEGSVVDHAQLTLGTGMIMLGSASRPNPHPEQMAHPDAVGGRVTSPTYVVVPDCHPVYARAQAEGTEIISELKTMD